MPPIASPSAHLKSLTRQESAYWAGRRVGLYGGSFNPGHDGHLHVAIEALKRLPLDGIWFMVSPGNPLKDSADMAPFDARYQSAQELADMHPKLAVTDIEARIGSRYTAETVDTLVGLFPRTQFLWMMGADNLAQFDQWYRWQDIMAQLPVAVFDRPAYSVSGFAGKMARRFASAQVPSHKLLSQSGARLGVKTPRWSFIRMPRHPASATDIRRRLGHDWLVRGWTDQSQQSQL